MPQSSCGSLRNGTRWTEVQPGVIHIDLPWTNVWALYCGPDIFLIDTGTRWDRTTTLQALKSAIPGMFHISSVLLTHGHCDHAGNAAYFCESFGAKLIAGKAEEPFIATRKTYVPKGVAAIGPKGAVFTLCEVAFPVKRRAVDVCVSDRDCISSPIGTLRVVDTPGHTPGHVAYYLEERGVLFSGDALLTVIPFRRVGGLSIAPLIFSTNCRRARESVRRLAELEPAAVFAGHGWPWTNKTAVSVREYAESLPP